MEYDIAIIGGGPAGYIAAERAGEQESANDNQADDSFIC
ncbi:flavin-dependent dehydrogenase [Parabacteroides sp. PF5-5]|nr:flavin-dependent dehydrogenase [Parabacteroides sp. PH5-39]MDH6316084.1 flavin-dependent dehydrogenase [Parabacteroides sp. PF5-13]MDH6320234.1 flavin-dependent dehydrogenase [Parabacteroides sp. PH5-13]MDH6323964.1 flavin-dependent dehydrogenase [Parabacteroides sp. PH5-8]MDH6327275.1 flavin-dependent dehydrogenase [Parabacteroides sp. PH5-41]MDH6335077.1 flavin-dependent dehydrogenase [Parabacteroides sp. PF5-5]MDH6346302.1 flavin-dependent dehydrogenase [Parabacteroides sp. PH5-46]MDH6